MRDFWIKSPVYIVICVLLGFVIAGLLTQNLLLKEQLDRANGQIAEIKKDQDDAKKQADATKAQADRIIAYLRCVSLTPIGERSPELIDKCLTEDLPPQLSTGNTQGTAGGPNFLAPAPSNGATQQPNKPVDNSPGNSGQTPADPPTENPQQQGIIPSLCTNLTPRACATLGL